MELCKKHADTPPGTLITCRDCVIKQKLHQIMRQTGMVPEDPKMLELMFDN